jgi:hypothetical protein
MAQSVIHFGEREPTRTSVGRGTLQEIVGVVDIGVTPGTLLLTAPAAGLRHLAAALRDAAAKVDKALGRRVRPEPPDES